MYMLLSFWSQTAIVAGFARTAVKLLSLLVNSADREYVVKDDVRCVGGHFGVFCCCESRRKLSEAAKQTIEVKILHSAEMPMCMWLFYFLFYF